MKPTAQWAFAGPGPRNRSFKCWIVTAGLDVVRVRAEYHAKSSRWHYWLPSETGGERSYSGCAPYFPTLGNGNKSYWGDGPLFRTKAQAAAAQREYARRVRAELRREYSDGLRKALASVAEKVRAANSRPQATWYCQKCGVEVPKGERCKYCGKTKREKS